MQDDTYAIDMFNQYKEQIMYNQDAIYDNLDEEYKKAKFANISEFKTYIKNRYKNPIMLKAESFNKTIRKEYTEYVFIDANGEYYIFKETAPMKYKIVLDTYTIDIPEFIAKYESANLQEKVVLNLNKFQEAINDKDYKYAYGLLADSFKENNFQTQAEFENYVKTNFFENNKFEYIEYGNEANTYHTYEVKITDETGRDTRKVVKTFIILLEEGTKFKLSFNK